MNRPIVAVLDTMWGDRAGRAPRHFKINPYNHSGKRLYRLVGERNAHRLLVTNACRELVVNANQHGKPDPEWLADNLRRLNPALILVCGSIAQRTFERSGFIHERHPYGVLYIHHPAARCWTKKLLREVEREIQKAI